MPMDTDYCKLVVVLGLFLANTDAQAQDVYSAEQIDAANRLLDRPLDRASSLQDDTRLWSGSVACFKVNTRQRDLVELSINAASNRFGPTAQQVGQLAMTWDRCINRRARLHAEASIAAVSEEGRQAQAAFMGLGYKAEIAPFLTLTPIARLGVETFESGLTQTVYNAGVIAEVAFPVSRNLQGPLVQMVLAPEYSDRQVASSSLPVARLSRANVSNRASVGLDFQLRDRDRATVRLGHQYISGPTATSQVASMSLGTRRLVSGGAGYSWAAQLLISRGNGDFWSVGLGVSFRLGPRGQHP